jgi:hypothetical protein
MTEEGAGMTEEETGMPEKGAKMTQSVILGGVNAKKAS